MNPMFRFLSASILVAAAVAQAEPLTFDFKDPKGVNNAVFKLDAPLEAISGSASGISGTVVYDPGNPGATRGKIVVASGSLQVPNPMMQQHMLGEKWLDVAKHSEITFEVREFKNVKTVQGVTSGDVQGAFTLRGITKEMTVPVKLTYLKDKLSQRVPNQKGDLLVIRANFEIKRSDFNINPGQNEDKVADVIEVTLSIAGAAAR